MSENFQLPGLPDAPKRRGRPASGRARTPAQRKRDQRSKTAEVVLWGSLDELDSWVVAASPAQLLEAYSLAMRDRGQALTAVAIAEALVVRAKAFADS